MNETSFTTFSKNWASAFFAYLSLTFLMIWMLWTTPEKSTWHLLGLAGFIFMPLSLIAMGRQRCCGHSPIRYPMLAFMGIAGYANVIFIPSLKHWYETSIWGVGKFYVPSRTVYPFGFGINSEKLITVHAFSATLLALLITLQWILMLRQHRDSQSILLHRRIGAFTLGVALPVMAVSGILSSIYVLRTPFNQATYAALPLLISGCLIVSVKDAIEGNIRQHIDHSYSAFIILCSAALYRFICLFIYLAGHPFRIGQVPIDAAAILTYLTLIVFLVVPFLMIGRLKQNLFPVITLCSILLLSIIYIPWQFFGAPESSNFLGHLVLF